MNVPGSSSRHRALWSRGDVHSAQQPCCRAPQAILATHHRSQVPPRARHTPILQQPPGDGCSVTVRHGPSQNRWRMLGSARKDTSHKHSNTREQQRVNPHLLTQNWIPNNSACPQRIRVSNKLIRPLSAREELTDTPLPAVDKLSLLEQKPHQRRRPVVVRLGGYITSLQLRNTIQSDSLECATQLLGQLSFNVGTNIPGDWEPFIRFNLQSGYIRVLLIKQEERRMAMSMADTHA